VYKTDVLIEQTSYHNQTFMLQQLCIICILHQALVGAKYLSKMDYKTDNINSKRKTMIDYEKRIENEMKDENYPN
jgi:hypothetical protein